MKVSRNKTASMLLALAVGGTLYFSGASLLQIPELAAAEGAEEPFIINGASSTAKPDDDAASQPQRQSKVPAARPAAPAGSDDMPFGIEARSPEPKPGPAANDQPFGMTGTPAAAPAPTQAESKHETSEPKAAEVETVETIDTAAKPVMPAENEMAKATAPEPETLSPETPAPVKRSPVKPAGETSPAADQPADTATTTAGTMTVPAGKAPVAEIPPSKTPLVAPVIAKPKTPAVPAEPGESVITCFAGCGHDGKEVYRAEIPAQGTGPKIDNAATLNSGDEAAPTIDCVAGCYQTPKSYSARPAPAMPAIIKNIKNGKDQRAETATVKPIRQASLQPR